MPRLIILISGKRYSGKDYQADILLSKFKDAKKFAFADELKRYCAQKYQLDFNCLKYDNTYKETHRLCLIETAQHISREIGSTHWANMLGRLLQTYDDNLVAVISDWRFPHEYQVLQSFFPEAAFLKLRIEANDETRKARGWIPNILIDQDISEIALDNEKFDYILE